MKGMGNRQLTGVAANCISIRQQLPQLDYAPVAFLSAKEGQNVEATIELLFELQQQAKTSAMVLIEKKTFGDVWERWPELRQPSQGVMFDENHMSTRHVRFFHELQDLNIAKAWMESRGAVLALWGEYDWVSSREDHERIAEIVVTEFDVPWVRVRLNKQGAIRGSRSPARRRTRAATSSSPPRPAARPGSSRRSCTRSGRAAASCRSCTASPCRAQDWVGSRARA